MSVILIITTFFTIGLFERNFETLLIIGYFLEKFDAYFKQFKQSFIVKA